MKRFLKYGVLTICAVPLSFAISGCSQNVGSNDDTMISQTPESIAPPPIQTTPKAAPTLQNPAQSTAASIPWEPSLDAALQKARATQKPIMIDFFATWCGPCKMLDAQIYPAPPVVSEGKNFVSVKIDVDQQKALAAKHKIGPLPTILFLNASGQEIHRVEGASMDPMWMVGEMKTALSRIAPTPA